MTVVIISAVTGQDSRRGFFYVPAQWSTMLQMIPQTVILHWCH